MKTIAIANQKGGVGKSTLAVHLVWYAEEIGKRVLLVDLDGQANSTRTFVEQPTGLAASALFRSDPDDTVPEQVRDGFGLIHADIGINDVEGLALDSIRVPVRWLDSFDSLFDLCVIDTPPNLGRRLLAALIAADCVVSPIALNGYALQGVEGLQRAILTVKKTFNPRLKNLGILPNLVNHRSTSQGKLLAQLRSQLGQRVLPLELTARVAVSDAIDGRHPVWKKRRGQSAWKAGREMRSACEELLRRVF